MTLNGFNKYRQCKKICEKNDIILNVYPKLLFLVKDKFGKNLFGKSLQGLNKTYRDLKSYDYNIRSKGEIAND